MTNDKDEIFDELFKQAITDKFDDELNSVLADSELEQKYQSSDEHKVKMKKLFSQEKQKGNLALVVKWYSRIASVLLLFVILGSSIVIAVPSLRTGFLETIIMWYDKSEVLETQSTGLLDIGKLEPEYIPKGYSVINSNKMEKCSTMLYKNSNEDIISVNLFRTDLYGKINDKDSENNVHVEGNVTVCNVLETQLDSFNKIVWQTSDYVVTVASNLPEDEILKICASIN